VGKPKLHTQILLALVLGALTGTYFHIDPSKVIVSFRAEKETQEQVMENWRAVKLQFGDRSEVFQPLQLPMLLRLWQLLPPADRKAAVLSFTVD